MSADEPRTSDGDPARLADQLKVDGVVDSVLAGLGTRHVGFDGRSNQGRMQAICVGDCDACLLFKLEQTLFCSRQEETR